MIEAQRNCEPKLHKWNCSTYLFAERSACQPLADRRLSFVRGQQPEAPDSLTLERPSAKSKMWATRLCDAQAQKVNYNLQQLTEKAWKRPESTAEAPAGASAPAQAPANAAYPPEDDQTEALHRVQLKSPWHNPNAGESMST